MAHVYFTDHVILAACRCMKERKLNVGCKLPEMHFHSRPLSLRILLASFSFIIIRLQFSLYIGFVRICPFASKKN